MAESGNVVRFPHREPAPDPDVFLEEVLEGWSRAQRARGLKEHHISVGRRNVRRLSDFSGKFPWEWLPADADEWFTHLRAVKNLAHATLRRYQGSISSFCDFVTDVAYDWSIRSATKFGSVFSQVITAHNRITHSQENESRPEKRAFSLQELSQLFDLLDLEYERILDSGRNGAITHLRDVAAFKTAYAWGLRENEVRHLQVVDFSPNYRAPNFGDFGTLNVRWGKSKRGQAHKPRNVLTVFDWSAEVAEDWINRVLPRYGQPLTDLFPTNTGGIVAGSHLWRRMDGALDELGFPPGLDFHSLRRSYSTHLLTVYGYDLKFVSLQLGHEHAATTSIYTLPAPDFQVMELARVHGETLKASGARRVASGQRLRLPPPPPLKNRKRK